MWVIEDSISSKFGKPSLGEALNATFGINDMDMSVLAERLSHSENKFMRFAYLFASRPDYYNRLISYGWWLMGLIRYPEVALSKEDTTYELTGALASDVYTLPNLVWGV